MKSITSKNKSKISTPSRKITKETKFDKIMKINPDAGMILFEYGMHCVGCGMASMETLEQGCVAHGMEKKEIEELIERLNEKKEKISADDKKKVKKIKKLPKENSIKKLKEIVR